MISEFYVKVDGQRVPVLWHATFSSLIHASTDGEFAVLGPVAVVLWDDAPRKLRTPEGRTVFVCPAQTHSGVTCASCQVCSRPRRTSIVGFLAHGDAHATVSLTAKRDAP